ENLSPLLLFVETKGEEGFPPNPLTIGVHPWRVLIYQSHRHRWRSALNQLLRRCTSPPPSVYVPSSDNLRVSCRSVPASPARNPFEPDPPRRCTPTHHIGPSPTTSVPPFHHHQRDLHPPPGYHGATHNQAPSPIVTSADVLLHFRRRHRYRRRER
ncbi:hypothetical protein U1Q18_018111, partial [Sarracenia purpurea var. burkii]